MKKMKDVPQNDRPREKIASKGASALSDTELIEAILGRGTKNRDVREISKEINRLMLERGNAIGYNDLPRSKALCMVQWLTLQAINQGGVL